MGEKRAIPRLFTKGLRGRSFHRGRVLGISAPRICLDGGFGPFLVAAARAWRVLDSALGGAQMAPAGTPPFHERARVRTTIGIVHYAHGGATAGQFRLPWRWTSRRYRIVRPKRF